METYSVRLVEGLSRNHDIDLTALAGRKNGLAPSVFQLLTFGFMTAFKTPFQKKADIVHLADGAIWPLAWLQKIFRKGPTFISVHGSDVSYAFNCTFKGRLYKSYMKLGAKLVATTHIIANSSYTGNLSRQLGFKNVQVINLATEMTPDGETIEETDKSILFVGRIQPGKGLSWFVEHILPQLSGSPTLNVIGTIWSEAEARCLEHEQVEYLGTFDAQELARRYSQAELVIVPSIAPEGFGLVAIEAIRSGTVVIAADHSGLRDACANDMGFLAPIDNPQFWIDTIYKIRSWPKDIRRDYIAKTQEKASYFSWERLLEQTEQAYTSLKL